MDHPRHYRTLALALALVACGEPPAPDDLPLATPVSDAEVAHGETSHLAAPVVDVESGRLQGVKEAGLLVFRGVPFAAPPVGARRLRDPIPHPAWSGTRDASAFGPACPQAELDAAAGGVGPTSEDCLTLNVWAPETSSPKPVMVFLHGGAFFYGAGSEALYDGAAVASEGVVYVSLNYRLGTLGFLAHDDLGATVGNTGSGNFGLKDVILALEWVRRNIAAFGGDAHNVTVFGQSAGGLLACSLIGVPSADALFDKAVLQSAVTCDQLPTATTPAPVGGPPQPILADDLVEELGCAEVDDTLACLQTVPVEAFVQTVDVASVFTDINAPIPMPYVDGELITQQPAAVLASGASSRPLLLGTTADDASIFFAAQTPRTWFGMPGAVEELVVDPALTDPVLDLYPQAEYSRAPDAFFTFTTDLFFACPSRAMAEAATSAAPVYAYEFQDITPATSALGAHHALELPYLFDTFEVIGIEPTLGDRRLGSAMRQAWTTFAATGAPTIAGGWPDFTPGGTWMRLDDDFGTMSDADFRDGRCTDLDELGLVPAL